MSFLNGLNAAGTALSQFAGAAGLEQQKADLARQSLMLADQLATNRELNVTQPFQASQQAISEQGANTRNAATIAGSQQVATIGAGATIGSSQISANAAIMAERERAASAERINQANINADTPEIKTLRSLGMLPPRADSTPSVPMQTNGGAPPPSSGGGAALPAVGAPFNSSASGSGSPATPLSPGQSASPSTPLAPSGAANPPAPAPLSPAMDAGTRAAIAAKLFGAPLPGSEAALRFGIANDVNNDPAFKDKTPGQKAAETETRVAVAEGKMTDPDSRAGLAASIASYQMAPLTGYAMTKPGAPETMALVTKINPEYQATRYEELGRAMAAFGTGKQGDIVRAGNVGVQHLAVLDQAAQALNNGDVRAINSLSNMFASQFGSSPPTTFDALKQIVGTEIEKAVAGGIGALADRDRIMDALNRANSPQALQDVTNGFRSLLVGQLNGLKKQYEDATGITRGTLQFDNKLDPAVAQMVRLANSPASAKTPTNRPPLGSILTVPQSAAPAPDNSRVD